MTRPGPSWAAGYRLLAAVAAALLLLLLPLAAGTAGAVPPSVPYWVVPGEPGTASDLTLAGVADRVLGDARRAPELFDLNEGRTQPDGLALTDPDQPIMAGWVFVLPAGATSGEIRIGPPPSAMPNEGQQSADRPQANPPVPGAPAADGGEILGFTPVTATLLGGGAVLLAVAGPVLLLLARRRAARAVHPAPTPGSRQVLDRALRQLAGQSTQAQVYAALVGAERVSLRLAPALSDAPPPWRARQQGAIWETPTWQLDESADSGDGLPLLATVGTVQGELAVVNLARAPGIVALTGDSPAAISVARTFLDEIGRHAAAASLTVSVVGPPSPIWPASEQVRIVPDARTVLTPAAGDIGASHRPDVLHDHLVLVTTVLPPAELERLGALAATSGSTAAVLVVGDAPNAAWRFTVDADGTLDVGVLDLDLDRRPPRGRVVSNSRR